VPAEGQRVITNGNITDARPVDAEFIRDLFEPFGAITVRRMFGGAGLFADGVMFGLVSCGQIYLKVDTTTVTCFEREHCGPFEYSTKNGKRALTSYWRLPERLYDDADELAQWARQALAAAREGAVAMSRAGKRRMKTKRLRAKFR
jgi:DNA transformation protein